MSKVMIVGDIHFADKAPSSCTDTYTDDLFDLMYHTVRIAKERDVAAVAWAGDVIHLKTPYRTTHGLVQRIIELAGAYHCPVYVVPGNHDLQHDRFETLFESQPLGTILMSGAAHLLTGWRFKPSWMGYDYKLPTKPSVDPDVAIYGVPWLQDWANLDEGIREQSVSAATSELRKMGDDVSHSLLITHAPFYPPGQELPYENYPTDKFADKLPENTSVYYGHIHQPHGIYESNGIKFANQGAISRGSLHEYNLNRGINVTLWDSSTGLFEVVSVPHKPASEVFKLEEVKAQKQVQMELDAFLSSVGKTSIEITSIESVLQHVKTMDLPVEVIKTIENLLEAAN